MKSLLMIFMNIFFFHRDNSLSYSLTCGGAEIRVLLWSDLGKCMFESFVQQLTNVFAGIIMGFGEIWSTPEDILEAISVSFTVEGHPAISAPFHRHLCSVCSPFCLIYQLWYIPLIFYPCCLCHLFMLIDYSSGRSFSIKIVIFSINIGLLTPRFKPHNHSIRLGVSLWGALQSMLVVINTTVPLLSGVQNN